MRESLRILGPETSAVLKGSTEIRAERLTHRIGKDAIQRLTATATLKEAQGAVSALQVVVAKTYGAVLYKSTGRVVPGLEDDLGLTDYFLQQRISKEELRIWLEEAQTREFSHTPYAPLPSKAQAVALFKEVRARLQSQTRAAEEAQQAVQQRLALPEKPMSVQSARNAVEFGVCRMLPEQDRRRICELLTWEELGEEMQRYFFTLLSENKQSEIKRVADKQQRKQMTAQAHKQFREKL